MNATEAVVDPVMVAVMLVGAPGTAAVTLAPATPRLDAVPCELVAVILIPIC